MNLLFLARNMIHSAIRHCVSKSFYRHGQSQRQVGATYAGVSQSVRCEGQIEVEHCETFAKLRQIAWMVDSLSNKLLGRYSKNHYYKIKSIFMSWTNVMV